jgi:hypothetical protein
MSIDKCLRCGQCCYAYYKKIKKKCKYLKENNECSIYPRRLGALIATIHNKNFYCVMREVSDMDYPNCPYNSGKRFPRTPSKSND